MMAAQPKCSPVLYVYTLILLTAVICLRADAREPEADVLDERHVTIIFPDMAMPISGKLTLRKKRILGLSTGQVAGFFVPDVEPTTGQMQTKIGEPWHLGTQFGNEVYKIIHDKRTARLPDRGANGILKDLFLEVNKEKVVNGYARDMGFSYSYQYTIKEAQGDYEILSNRDVHFRIDGHANGIVDGKAIPVAERTGSERFNVKDVRPVRPFRPREHLCLVWAKRLRLVRSTR